MALVLVFGAATNGSTRWINIGFFTFQPSEFGKVLLALVPRRRSSPTAPRRSARLGVPLKAIACAAVPIVLVFAQPDVGTALVYISVLAAALFVSGVRWLHLALIGAVALIARAGACSGGCPPPGVNVLKPYQTARLTGFTHPSTNPNDPTSYNLDPVDDRGRLGRAARGAASPARPRPLLDYLPGARHRLRLRLARRAARLLRRLAPAAPLPAGRLAGAQDRDRRRATSSAPSLAGGIVFGFLFQVFVNVGMTIGIAPITGIPLPFVSVGGSSMISNLPAIGILQSIAARGGRRRA